MARYENFEVALYFTTRCIESIGPMESFAADFAFFEKYLKCSRVYLETHRDDMDIPAKKLKELCGFFMSRGIKVSGAITTTFMKTISNKPMIDETGVIGCGGTVLGKSQIPETVDKGFRKSWSNGYRL